MGRILVVEDDEIVRQEIGSLLAELGHRVELVPDAEGALERMETTVFDLIITDHGLPGRQGLDLLKAATETERRTAVIMITGMGSPRLAIEAARSKAFEYLEKPFMAEDLQAAVERAFRAVKASGLSPAPGMSEEGSFVGRSTSMRRVYQMIGQAARGRSPVLVVGPTGSGKELAARAIHRHSDRGDGPFVSVNSGAMAEGILEAELFGHERGAFTGAQAARRGLFEQANGGTLFLDEVAELSAGAQAALLRVLQDGEVRPVGSERSVRVDVRVICATHRELDEMVKGGQFRADLFFRLCGVMIRMPSLAERRDDIPELALRFLEMEARALDYGRPSIAAEALECLCGMPWEGNVRELQHMVRRLTLAARGFCITREMVESDVMARGLLSRNGQTDTLGTLIEVALAQHEGRARDYAVKALEDRLVTEALRRTGGNRARAGELLGVSQPKLRSHIRAEDGE